MFIFNLSLDPGICRNDEMVINHLSWNDHPGPPKQNPPHGGFALWLADQDYSRGALTLRAVAVTATF